MKQYHGYVFLGAVLSLFFLACGTYTGSLPTPEQLAKAGSVPEGLDLVSLRRGRALAMTECVGCHRFFYPREYSPEEWNEIILKHAKRLSLGKKQLGDLQLYFQTASMATPCSSEGFALSEME